MTVDCNVSSTSTRLDVSWTPSSNTHELWELLSYSVTGSDTLGNVYASETSGSPPEASTSFFIAGDTGFTATVYVQSHYGTPPSGPVVVSSILSTAATCSRAPPTNTPTHTATNTPTPTPPLPTVMNLLYACGDNGNDAVVTWTTEHFTTPAIAGFSGSWVVTSGDFAQIYDRPWPTPVETSPGHWQTSHNFAAQFGLAPGDTFVIFFIDVSIDFDGGQQSSAVEYATQVTCTVQVEADTPTHTWTPTPTNTSGPTPTHTHTPTPTLGLPPAPGNVTITCTVNTTNTVVTLDWDDSPEDFQLVSFQTYRVQFDLTPGMDVVHPPVGSGIRLTDTSYPITVNGDAAFTVTGQVQVQYGDTVSEIATSVYSAVTATTTCSRDAPTDTPTHTATNTPTPIGVLPTVRNLLYACGDNGSDAVITWTTDHFTAPAIAGFSGGWVVTSGDFLEVYTRPWPTPVETSPGHWQTSHNFAAQFGLDPGDEFIIFFVDVFIDFDGGRQSSAAEYAVQVTCTVRAATDTPTHTSTATSTSTNTATATPTLGVPPPPPATVTIDCVVAVTSTVVSLSWDPSPARFQRVDLHSYRVNLDFDPNDDADIVHPPVNSAVRLTATSYQVTVTGDAAFTVTGQVQVQYGDTVPEITTSIYSSVTAASTCARAPPTATHTFTSTATATHTATATATPTLGVPPSPDNVTIDCAVAVTSTVVSLSWDPSPARFQRVDLTVTASTWTSTPTMTPTSSIRR